MSQPCVGSVVLKAADRTRVFLAECRRKMPHIDPLPLLVIEADDGASVMLSLDGKDRALTQNGLLWRNTDALQLKAGIHTGPCIAVTLNDRLDYFGSTVNMAARLQATPGTASAAELIERLAS